MPKHDEIMNDKIVRCPVKDCTKSYPVHSLAFHVQKDHNLPKARIVFRHNGRNELYAELREPNNSKSWFKQPRKPQYIA